jgi:hypothetical protein
MSDIRQNIVFNGSGLDTDTDIHMIANGDGRERRNVLVGGDESNGILINMFGNERPVNWSDVKLNLSYCYRVIGSYYNRLQRAVYYMVFSLPYELESGGASSSSSTSTTTTTESGDLVIDYTSGTFEYDNMLLRYWEDTRTIDVIFRDRRNYFGLHYDYPMKDMTMIGDRLYFTPRVSEPKMIDVEMAYNYTNYDAYDPTLTYVYGDYVTYYGGLFMANASIAVGETPVTTEAKWDRIGNSYQDESNLTGFDSEFRYAFNVIRQCPVARPTLRYGTDTSVNSNNVRKKLLRFSHKFRYFDDTSSVYSAFSDVSLPEDDELYNGEILNNVTLGNYINITIQLHSPALIKEIEIIYQEIGGSWKRIKTVNRRERDLLTDSTYVYKFYNNEAYDEVDDSYVLRVNDSVPQKANSQEIINKNILCYAGCTEGYENIPKEDIDVTLTPELQEFEPYTGVATFRRNSITEFDIAYGSEPDATWNIATAFAAAGLVNGDMVIVMLNGVSFFSTFTGAHVATADALTARMRELLAAWYPTFSFTISGQTIECDTIIAGDTLVFDTALFYEPIGTLSTLTKKRGFKTGAFHPFCLYYYDGNLRRLEASTSKENTMGLGYSWDGTTVYVPMPNEISPLPGGTNYKWNIKWEVNHLPPADAKYWRWGYAGNSLCSYFVQYVVSSISDGIGDEANMTVIDITPLQELKFTEDTAGAGIPWNQYPNSNISSYQWEKGDRIRFLTVDGDPTTPDTNLGDLVDGVYDMEIIKQGDVSGSTYSKYHDYDATVAYISGQLVRYDSKLYQANNAVAAGETPGNTPAKWDEQPDPFNSIYVQEFNYGDAGITAGVCCLVEIYRPLKKASKEVYYEFGGLLRIIEDGDGVLVHEGISQNQDTLLDIPAMGTFSSGDVYHILRTPSILLDNTDPTVGVFHESMWWSDFYKSDDWDKGKAGVESNFGERHLNIIRYSNQYLQDTAINGLSTFEALNYKELNNVFGKIVAIYELGDTLRCYQERKASSILIGRTEYSDADGNTTVAISKSVLGAIRYSTTNFSTVFPECISRNNKFIYGFDIYNGVVFRDTTNGIFPISGRYVDANGESDYRMSHYFKDKSKALLESGIDHCDVMSVWDEEFKNLYVIFKDYVNEINNETIVFHEPSNRWICKMDLDQTPPFHNEFLEPTYEITQGFEGGLGYTFDEDTRFAVFDIVTPMNGVVMPDTISMAMTPYAPTVLDGSLGTQTNIVMGATIYAPDVHISYITLDTNFLEWQYYEAGTTVSESVLVTTTEPSILISSMPAWMSCVDADGHTIVAGETPITNGEYIYPYPISGTDTYRQGQIKFVDSFGNEAIIYVIQYAES